MKSLCKMRSKYCNSSVGHTRCVLGYSLYRYRAGNPIDRFRERIEVIPLKAVWK